MEAGFRKYVHREVDMKRLAEKEKRRKKKEILGKFTFGCALLRKIKFKMLTAVSFHNYITATLFNQKYGIV